MLVCPVEDNKTQVPHLRNIYMIPAPQILSCYIFVCEIFVSTCWMMAWERAETCRIHVKAQLSFK